MNPATLGDLTASGYDDPRTSDIVRQRRLDQAWRALRLELPCLTGRIAAGTIDPEAVADVVVAAAMRVLDNPDGREAEEFAVDDYRESWRRANATTDFYFTAAELRRLRGTDAAQQPYAGSIPYDR